MNFNRHFWIVFELGMSEQFEDSRRKDGGKMNSKEPNSRTEYENLRSVRITQKEGDGTNAWSAVTDATGSVTMKTKPTKAHENWSSSFEGLLSLVGFAMGVENVWKFPFLVQKYGGGSFLLAHWLVFFAVAYPIFFMELSLGQFHSRGPVHIFRNIAPAFDGLGFATLLVTIISAVYHNGIFAWNLYYVFASFSSYWTTCNVTTNKDWNTEHCVSMDEYERCIGTELNPKWYVKGSCYDTENVWSLLDHFDACLMHTYGNSNRTSDILGMTTHSNCSFAFHLNFKTRVSAERFLFGNSTTSYGGTVSSCWGRKDGYCIFDVENCGKVQSEEGAVSKMIGKRILDFRYRRRYESVKKLMRRKVAIEKTLSASYHSKLSDMLKQYCGTTNIITCLKPVLDPDESFSSDEFYRHILNTHDGSFSNPVGYQAGLPLALAIASFLVGIGAFGGPSVIGKIMYFTVIFPVAVLILLSFIALSISGSSLGIQALFELRLCELGKWDLWINAANNVIFSLGIGCGGLHSIASFNKFDQDLQRDSLIAALSARVLSLFAGIFIFGFIGHLADVTGTSVEFLLGGSSESIAFVTFPQAVSSVWGGQAVAFLFYFVLSCLAFNTQLVFFHAATDFLYKEFTTLQKWKTAVVTGASVSCFILGLLNVTRAGASFMSVIDGATYDWLAAFCVLAEIVLMIFVYGLNNLMGDIEMMVGYEKKCRFHAGNWVWNSPLRHYFTCTLLVTAPIGMLLITFATIMVSYILRKPSEDVGNRIFFWLIGGLAFPVLLIGGAFFSRFKRNIPLQDGFKPVPICGSILNEKTDGRNEKSLELDSTQPTESVENLDDKKIPTMP